MVRLAILAGVSLAASAAPAQTVPPAGAADRPAVHEPSALQPEAPIPPDAILPGAAGIAAILCEVDPPPVDASGALGLPADSPVAGGPRRSVVVQNPWGAAPVMTGAGTPVDVTFFKRGRTLIFDAGTEVLYLDRDHRRFTYTHRDTGNVTTWRGICRPEG